MVGPTGECRGESRRECCEGNWDIPVCPKLIHSGFMERWGGAEKRADSGTESTYIEQQRPPCGNASAFQFRLTLQGGSRVGLGELRHHQACCKNFLESTCPDKSVLRDGGRRLWLRGNWNSLTKWERAQCFVPPKHVKSQTRRNGCRREGRHGLHKRTNVLQCGSSCLVSKLLPPPRRNFCQPTSCHRHNFIHLHACKIFKITPGRTVGHPPPPGGDHALNSTSTSEVDLRSKPPHLVTHPV